MLKNITSLSETLKNYWKSFFLIFFLLHSFIYVVSNTNFTFLEDTFLKLNLQLLILTLWLKKENLKVDFNWCVWLGLGLFLIFLSVHSSEDYWRSSEKSLLDLSIIIFFVLLVINFKEELRKNTFIILFSIVATFVILALPITLYELFNFNVIDSVNFYKTGENSELRLRKSDFTFYRHIRHFSYHAFIASCFSYILWSYAPASRYLLKKILFVIMLICFSSVLLTAGRAAVLALICFYVADGFFARESFKQKIILCVQRGVTITLVICLSYVAIYYSSFSYPTELFFDQFIRSVNQDSLSNSLNVASTGRLRFWEDALIASFDRPIYGYGASAYSFLDLFGSGAIAHPHNALIQFILEYGYVGTIIFIVIGIKYCMQFLLIKDQLNQDNNIYFSLIAFLIAFLFYGIFDGVLFHPLPVFYFCFVVALMHCLNFVETKNQDVT